MGRGFPGAGLQFWSRLFTAKLASIRGLLQQRDFLVGLYTVGALDQRLAVSFADADARISRRENRI
jgi:hypothetical protein